ncbi:hypothetical protein CIB48_g10630 [Xylaria polymorpha]|nr:hypothetical protein CIB48_g10630 [Xylaria polymorpha]
MPKSVKSIAAFSPPHRISLFFIHGSTLSYLRLLFSTQVARVILYLSVYTAIHYYLSQPCDAPAKQQHQFSNLPPTNDTALAEERVRSYMMAINGGGDPVTALGVRNATAESSIADRLTGVLQSTAASLVNYQNGVNSGV